MPYRTVLFRARRKGVGYLAKIQRLARSLRPEQARPDDIWASQYLTSGEARVYFGMDSRDREHACRVTRHLLKDHPFIDEEVIAAALLHDCGKSVRRYSVIERVLVGLIPNRIARFLPPFGPIGIRAHHPELGARLLAHLGARPAVARLVARHHHPMGDPDAELLHHYDEQE